MNAKFIGFLKPDEYLLSNKYFYFELRRSGEVKLEKLPSYNVTYLTDEKEQGL